MIADSTTSPTVRVPRRVLHQLRAALERDAGLQTASYLQEAGFAGGEEAFAAFRVWLAATHGVEDPADLDAMQLGTVLSGFFASQGWGELKVTPLGPAVLALDAPAWAEAADEITAEFPSCHITCGLLADFLGRLGDGLVAVMEVECRSRGDRRCRFLAGAPETLGALYERMSQGESYLEVLGVAG